MVTISQKLSEKEASSNVDGTLSKKGQNTFNLERALRNFVLTLVADCPQPPKTSSYSHQNLVKFGMTPKRRAWTNENPQDGPECLNHTLFERYNYELM